MGMRNALAVEEEWDEEDVLEPTMGPEDEEEIEEDEELEDGDEE